jgi:putative membrane protein insertion efficiency factor
MHLYTLTDSGLVQFGNARSLSCGSVMSGKDDVMMEDELFHRRLIRFCTNEEKFLARWESNRMNRGHRLWRCVAMTPRAAGRALVKLYRLTLSPLIGFHCRYLPTCSDYADQALERHGLWAGGWMTAARLMRCHPWGNSGLDFVPDVPPRDARWYLPWRYGRWRGTNAEPAPKS